MCAASVPGRSAPVLPLPSLPYTAPSIRHRPARSYAFKSHSTAQNVVLFINVFCMILMIASLIMSQVSSTCRADESLRYVWRLLPGFSLGNGLITLSFLDVLPIIDATCDIEHGIFPSEAVSYDALDMRATGTNLVFMAVEAVVYLLIAIGIDVMLSYPRLRLLCRREPRPAPLPPGTVEPPEDEDVAAERARVHAEVASDTYSDAIVLDGLRKVRRGTGEKGRLGRVRGHGKGGGGGGRGSPDTIAADIGVSNDEGCGRRSAD